MPNIEIINPVQYHGWDELVLAFPGCTIFHSSAWAKVLSEAYGYRPVYFALKKEGRISAILPLMEIRSFLTGARGVSLPFSDLCPVLTQSPAFLEPLIEEAKSYGRKKGWKHFDLRGANVSSQPYASYYVHHLDLAPGEQQIFSGLKSSNRRNIRKAIHEGVAVGFHSTLEALKAFYRLNCTTRKNHGLPPQPFNFFRKIHENILSKGLGFITLATHNGKTIAGAVYLHFGKTRCINSAPPTQNTCTCGPITL